MQNSHCKFLATPLESFWVIDDNDMGLAFKDFHHLGPISNIKRETIQTFSQQRQIIGGKSQFNEKCITLIRINKRGAIKKNPAKLGFCPNQLSEHPPSPSSHVGTPKKKNMLCFFSVLGYFKHHIFHILLEYLGCL